MAEEATVFLSEDYVTPVTSSMFSRKQEIPTTDIDEGGPGGPGSGGSSGPTYLMRASLAPGGNFQKYIYWEVTGDPDNIGTESGEDPSDLDAIGTARIIG